MNVKRMEVMIDDLSENFDRHVAALQENFYFVLPTKDNMGELSLRLYSKGGNIELEILAFAANGNEVNFCIKSDGEVIEERVGAITISPLAIAKGWHTIDIAGRGILTGRVRITGSISNVSQI